ncbi:MAG TPA: universal stress protein, partial [Actinoplanes sp.]|nr:universal stress protein [Actinoplanes sp.]
MGTATGQAIVVGVDGSECSLDAVEVAAEQAARGHRPLRIVHAFIWPLVHLGSPPGVVVPSIPQ